MESFIQSGIFSAHAVQQLAEGILKHVSYSVKFNSRRHCRPSIEPEILQGRTVELSDKLILKYFHDFSVKPITIQVSVGVSSINYISEENMVSMN